MIHLLKLGRFLLMEAHLLPKAYGGSPEDHQLLLKPGDAFTAGGNGPTSSEDPACLLPPLALIRLVDQKPAPTLCRNKQFSRKQAHLIQA